MFRVSRIGTNEKNIRFWPKTSSPSPPRHIQSGVHSLCFSLKDWGLILAFLMTHVFMQTQLDLLQAILHRHWIRGKYLCHGMILFSKVVSKWTSLVVQWMRICLPLQGTRVWFLVWEDPTCRGATEPVSCNCWNPCTWSLGSATGAAPPCSEE